MPAVILTVPLFSLPSLLAIDTEERYTSPDRTSPVMIANDQLDRA